MSFIKSIYVALLCLIAQPAFASDPAWSSCTTIDSVSGMNEEAPYLEVGSLADFDGKNYLILRGRLETPSGGYSYSFEHGDVVDHTQHVALKLIPPEQEAAAVISSISIMERFEVTKPINQVEIRLVKGLNWGPTQIDCSLN
tara:strand:+ start:420697 stop:421122 length:426 start_codon:yes stop_codon:yes gene_type:complete